MGNLQKGHVVLLKEEELMDLKLNFGVQMFPLKKTLEPSKGEKKESMSHVIILLRIVMIQFVLVDHVFDKNLPLLTLKVLLKIQIFLKILHYQLKIQILPFLPSLPHLIISLWKNLINYLKKIKTIQNNKKKRKRTNLVLIQKFRMR